MYCSRHKPLSLDGAMWLYATVYYGNNFDEVNNVIESCDRNDAM